MSTQKSRSIYAVVALIALLGLLAAACAPASTSASKAGTAYTLAQALKASVQAVIERAEDAVASSRIANRPIPGLWDELLALGKKFKLDEAVAKSIRMLGDLTGRILIGRQ